jgi:amino acid transporter
MTTDESLDTAPSTAPGLHAGVLPRWAVFATSIGTVAPAGGLALGIAGVALVAGNGTWLVFALMTVAFVGVGYSISWLARRFSSTGGLFGMASLATGPVGGYLQGAPQLLGLLAAVPAVAMGTGIYLAAFLGKLGLADSRPLNVACYLIPLAVAFALAVAEIRIASRVLLLLEVGSVGFILALFLIVLLHNPGPLFSHAQLTLHGLTVHGLVLGLAFAAYTLAGFENSATLGAESRNPRRDIPQAVLGTVLIGGLLTVLAGYIEVLGLPGGRLGAAAAPLSALANVAGVGWFSWILDLCIVASEFSCLLANCNGAARLLYTLGRDGALPRAFGRASRRGQPRFALICITAGGAVVTTVFAVTSVPPLQAFAYIGTLIGYLFLCIYTAAIVIAIIHAVRTRSLGFILIAASLAGLAIIGIALYFSFIPLPAGGYRVVAWIFLGLAAAVLLGLAAALRSRPAWWRQLGRSGGAREQAAE